MSSDDRLPFQRLEVYIAAKALAQAIHDASIRDPELRDQATRASKSTFCNLCEGLPSRSAAMRRKHFAIADGSLHEAVGAVDLAAAIGAVDIEHAKAVQALGARTLWLLRGLTRRR
jgi:four helix bundle protein